MNVRKTKIPGPLIIEPDIFYDDRGYFFESFNEKKYQEISMLLCDESMGNVPRRLGNLLQEIGLEIIKDYLE